ncbi:hypothetical protein ACMXYR_05455 [Neptuniibacter sp. QD29_5]|uniref:hypothetical protein n=1 Tax=Neptuniibacter sp. QD29_5 TaxID=3398207 RepID=UPI0039F4CA70
MGFIINGKTVEEHLNPSYAEPPEDVPHEQKAYEVVYNPPLVASDDPIISEYGTGFIKFAVPKESNIIPDSLLTKLLCSIRNRIRSSFRS